MSHPYVQRRRRPRPAWTGALTAGLLVALLAAPLGCGRKGKSTKTREPLTWEGLSLGMTTAKAKERLKALGWESRCGPAGSVIYLTKDTLNTRWVKAAEQKRAERCDARQRPPEGATKITKGLLRAKLFFLDGTLRQMNIVLAETDADLDPILRRRWGDPTQEAVKLSLYSGRREGQLRALHFRNREQSVLWLRKARLQELIFLPDAPDAVKALEAISTKKKNG